VLGTGSAVATLQDRSGNARDASQGTAASRPTFTAGSPGYLEFDGTDDSLTLPTMAALTAVESFVVFKLGAAVAATKAGVYQIGGGGGSNAHLPYLDSLYYDDAGSSTRKDGISVAGVDFTRANVWNVTSAAGAWTGRLNGVVKHGPVANTVAGPAAPTLGKAFATFLQGRVYALLIYSAALSAPNRATTLLYLQDLCAGVL
jgi:hypothetical protein